MRLLRPASLREVSAQREGARNDEIKFFEINSMEEPGHTAVHAAAFRRPSILFPLSA